MKIFWGFYPKRISRTTYSHSDFEIIPAVETISSKCGNYVTFAKNTNSVCCAGCTRLQKPE
jgi:hypothetical protein